MSFILDALRKSETDRRRTAEPMLATVPSRAAAATAPTWAWLVIVLLAVAVVGLGMAWWLSGGPANPASGFRAGAGGQEPAAIAGNVSAAAPAPQPGPAAVPAAVSTSAPAPSPAAPRPGSPALTQSVIPAELVATPERAAVPPRGTDVAAAPRTDRSSLPTYDAIRASAGLPELRLELHVYHQTPASRWVYINGGRYTEGSRLADGPALLEIVPEGVVLNSAGRDFLLLAQ